MENATVVIAIVLVLVGSFLITTGAREHYGAANEPHAGLNRAIDVDCMPYGWPGLQSMPNTIPRAFRGDSASALSHVIVRG